MVAILIKCFPKKSFLRDGLNILSPVDETVVMPQFVLTLAPIYNKKMLPQFVTTLAPSCNKMKLPEFVITLAPIGNKNFPNLWYSFAPICNKVMSKLAFLAISEFYEQQQLNLTLLCY